MTYKVVYYNKQNTITVEDGRVNSDFTEIKFVGRNVAGYGEIQNENFLWLLENFSSPVAPGNRTVGMIWYDSANYKLKFWDGSRADWRSVNGSELSTSPPTGLQKGDFWYDTTNKQLSVRDPDASTGYVLIGPQAVSGKGKTLFESVSMRDTDNNAHPVVKAYVDNTVVFITSKETFTTDGTDVPGITRVNAGLTLLNSSNTTNGINDNLFRFWGTASNSALFDGRPSTDFVTASGASFTDAADFANAGIRIGDSHQIKIYVNVYQDGLNTVKDAIIKNQVSSKLLFETTDSGNTEHPTNFPLILDNIDARPGEDLFYNLGTSDYQWKTVYAGDVYASTLHGTLSGSLTGIASKANTIKVYTTDPGDITWSSTESTHYRSATTVSTPYSVVARDSAGDIYGTVFHGVATSAKYADLAERYAADGYYDVGTVVVFGGENEITTTSSVCDTRVAGVVSGSPAYLMNAEAGDDSSHPAIALKGRIPVKVIGKVRKGDILVTSYIPGYAEVAQNQMTVPAGAIVGKSLDNKNTDESGTVTVVV